MLYHTVSYHTVQCHDIAAPIHHHTILYSAMMSRHTYVIISSYTVSWLYHIVIYCAMLGWHTPITILRGMSAIRGWIQLPLYSVIHYVWHWAQP